MPNGKPACSRGAPRLARLLINSPTLLVLTITLLLFLSAGQDYSWCALIFYVGQLIVEFPVLYLLLKLPIRTFVVILMLLWAGGAMCQAATQNFAGMMISRFLLGVTKGAVAPAFVVMVSFFYRKKEQPIQITAFVLANVIAQVIGALLLYGCGKIEGA